MLSVGAAEIALLRNILHGFAPVFRSKYAPGWRVKMKYRMTKANSAKMARHFAREGRT